MPTVLLVLATIGVTIYAVIDCLRTDDADLRSLPKPLWLLVIIGMPLLGGVLWIVLGHGPSSGTPRGRRVRTLAPDDDLEFLRSLHPPRRGSEEDDPS